MDDSSVLYNKKELYDVIFGDSGDERYSAFLKPGDMDRVTSELYTVQRLQKVEDYDSFSESYEKLDF